MARQQQAVVALDQPIERGHVVGHGAVRRRDDGGRPGHDMVGRKQDAGSFQRKSGVIGGVPRRQHGPDRPAVAVDDRVVGQRDIRNEGRVGTGVERD